MLILNNLLIPVFLLFLSLLRYYLIIIITNKYYYFGVGVEIKRRNSQSDSSLESIFCVFNSLNKLLSYSHKLTIQFHQGLWHGDRIY